jgi:RNA polymerase sigma-70 factor (family 1)
LLRALANDSDEAFTIIYQSYIDAIYGLSVLYVKQPSLAEDTAQTVFLKVWEKRKELLQLESFTNWLFIITRNQILSVLRKQSSEDNYRTYIKERMTSDASEDINYADQRFIEHTTFNIIQEAIAQLPPQQQMAFRLQREQGLTYEQIAEKMGVATNTIRKHLQLALAFIRQYANKHLDKAQLVLIYWLWNNY